MSALLELDRVSRVYSTPRGPLTALDTVSLVLEPGETLGIVGESGCGKTTLGRVAMRLVAPTSGAIRFEGRDIAALRERELRPLRARMQIVFQDPYSALNPRMRVGDIIAEPLTNLGWSRSAIAQRVAEVMDLVGLPAAFVTRFPHAFSGGQRQRIGIARALASSPSLLVADEAVSALDVSIQAQILNLLQDAQARLGLGMLFISHNLAVVRHVSHRVAVIYLGRIVEIGPEAALFSEPLHPYTVTLMSAVPEPDPDRPFAPIVLEGEPPSPIDLPRGCAFAARCPIARPRCAEDRPELVEAAPGHAVRCHFPGEFRR